MRRLQPALLGGLFIGVLSTLPIVSIVNVCCCAWVVVGGILTVYLQRQVPSEPGASDAAEAVFGGLIAGLVGGVIHAFAQVLLANAVSVAEIEQALGRFEIPAEIRDRVLQLATSGAFQALSALMTVAIYAIFAMIGALVGHAMFKKKPAVS